MKQILTLLNTRHEMLLGVLWTENDRSDDQEDCELVLMQKGFKRKG